ncbi:MAG TPA: YceI family protein [Candidatus Kapabacteria bacterium]|nr:YceI family protein [Candidatus Kapabacteria bacterium]
MDSNSVMNLTGTSAVRNWSMSAHTFTGTADFNLSADNQLLSITGFSIRLPVYSLKSESRETEKGAYKALKADIYQNIVFALTSAQFKPSGSDHYMILLRGNLSMAGVTRVAVLKMSGAIHEDSTISCTGSLPLSFSDFDIQRPSFLMGAMKVNNRMVLDYTLELVKSKHSLE